MQEIYSDLAFIFPLFHQIPILILVLEVRYLISSKSLTPQCHNPNQVNQSPQTTTKTFHHRTLTWQFHPRPSFQGISGRSRISCRCLNMTHLQGRSRKARLAARVKILSEMAGRGWAFPAVEKRKVAEGRIIFVSPRCVSCCETKALRPRF
jgi:hypothetical protein